MGSCSYRTTLRTHFGIVQSPSIPFRSISPPAKSFRPMKRGYTKLFLFLDFPTERVGRCEVGVAPYPTQVGFSAPTNTHPAHVLERFLFDLLGPFEGGGGGWFAFEPGLRHHTNAPPSNQRRIRSIGIVTHRYLLTFHFQLLHRGSLWTC